MPFSDLRQYIARLDQEGEVQRIEMEVQPVFEVAAVTQRTYDLRAAAPLFLNLRGYPGNRILGAPIGLSHLRNRTFARFAISLDMPPESTALEIIEEYIRRLKKPIKPSLVKDGPCKENVLKGDAVDVQIFPAPVFHKEDYGPYLGTWHANITRDPYTRVQRWEFYRLTMHDKKTLVGHFLAAPNKKDRCDTKNKPSSEPMEFAIAIGTEPVTPWVAGTRFDPGVSKADIIGGIRGAPLELIKCETVDLLVPATSEIVIEGFYLPHEQREEGSFGEYAWVVNPYDIPRPIYHVTAITHRNNPILPVSCFGMSLDDTSVSLSLTKAATILDDMRGRGFPVKAVYCPPEAVAGWTVVSTKVPYAGYAGHLANAIWSTDCGGCGGYMFIVEENVDVTDMGEVLRAISGMSHPARGATQMENKPSSLSPPSLSPEEILRRLGAYALSDCILPGDWLKEAIPVKVSSHNPWPQEVQERVLQNWRAYGYKGEA